MSFSYKIVDRTIIIDEGSTHIPALAFAGRHSPRNETKVVIPDSVKSIGERAFFHNQLTTVTIPDSVTSIGRAAFRLNNLKSVDLSNSLTYIPADAFSFNRITTLSGGDSVKRIGNGAFRDNKLQQIDFPSLQKIGSQAFARNKFRDIEIPHVERINLYRPDRGRWGAIGLCQRFSTLGAFEANHISKATLHPAVENPLQAIGTQVSESSGMCSSFINTKIVQNPSEIFGTVGDDEIIGNLWADNIFGDFGNDTINGDKGNDSIKGQQGDDLLKGKDGDDSLIGGEGDDSLAGGNGDDILIGGIGDNVYKGGEGNDTFEIAAYGTHSIKDFNAGEGDKIRLNTDNITSIINHGSVISINYNENGLLKVYGTTVLDVLSNIEFV